MIGRLPRTKRNLVLIALGLLILWFGWSIRSVINPLLIGYLCAFILHPLVVRVEQLGLSRRSAVTSGVPSLSSAQVLSPRSSDGWART